MEPITTLLKIHTTTTTHFCLVFFSPDALMKASACKKKKKNTAKVLYKNSVIFIALKGVYGDMMGFMSLCHYDKQL